MKQRYKVLIGIAVVLGLAIGQQPIQLQTYNGGGAVALGNGTAATALRVALPTDGTGVVGLIAGSAVIGHIISDGIAPSTSSTYALSRYHAASAAAAVVKASAGNLYGLVIGNSGTTPCFIQLFNAATTPTAGTSVVDSYFVQAGVTVVIPASSFAITNYSTGIAHAGATADGGATTTGCTTTISITAYFN